MKFAHRFPDEEYRLIHTGMRFRHGEGTEYILAQVAYGSYLLVSLKDGIRWDDANTLEGIAKQLNDADFKLV